MTNSTSAQRMAIGIICAKLKLDKETKETIIFNHSDGRTTTSTELTYAEADHLIKIMNASTGYEKSPLVKMRGKILSLAHEMRWELSSGKVDMDRVNNWCIKYGYLKKPLDKYTEAELPELVSQCEQAHLYFISNA